MVYSFEENNGCLLSACSVFTGDVHAALFTSVSRADFYAQCVNTAQVWTSEGPPQFYFYFPAGLVHFEQGNVARLKN